MRQFVGRHWKGLVVLLFIISLSLYSYRECQRHFAVPLQPIRQLDQSEVHKAFQDSGIVADHTIERKLVETVEKRIQSAPDIIYATATQAQADRKAQDLARADKADAVIKQAGKVPAVQVQSHGISNNYYTIHMEKLHKIKVGTSVVDSKVYLNIGYQNNKNEYMVQYSPLTNKYGATYMRTIAEW
jgi:hypothetical protein